MVTAVRSTSCLFVLAFFASVGCTAGTPGGVGSCIESSDCPSGEVCVDGACSILCTATPQCGTGLVCSDDGICVAEAGCGNGAIDGIEECDDRNLRSGDGCDATCNVEVGYTCGGAPSRCSPLALCGDGALDFGEGCDDSNAQSSDGCSSTCAEEAGYVCDNSVLPSICVLRCGNGDLDVGESCDDDNGANLDGCSSTCAIEAGWVCDTTVEPTECVPRCGNGLLDVGEGCDDQDNANLDGCSATCTVEGGWDCDTTVEPSVCSLALFCGDGLPAPNEDCDDNNGSTLDGCTGCQLETGWSCTTATIAAPSVCEPVPDEPSVDGETSAGHPDLTFLWTVPANTSVFRYQLDGGTEVEVSAAVVSATLAAGLGAHTFTIRACNGIGGCSDPVPFTTVYELFGGSYPLPWRGVAKTDLATTALGNVAAIACHNCYNDRPGNTVIGSAAALAKLNRASDRGADLIEIDIAMIGGTLYATHDDPGSPGSRPTLASLLADAGLRDSEAMLYVEIKESDTAPASFATSLLTTLDAHRDYVRNGRPIFLRGFDSQIAYLTALQDAVAGYPFLAPYVRFHVLYSTRAAIDTFQTEIETEVFDNGFDGVEMEYRNPNLFGAVMFAKSLGLTVGLWTIPGPAFGEVYLAALREDVDQLTTEYRVDQARSIVEAQNAAGYFNASTLSASPLTVRAHVGALQQETRILGVAPTASLYGTPPLFTSPVGEDLFAGALDFRKPEQPDRAVALFDIDANANEGFLVTAVVNFDVLGALPEGETMGIVNKSEGGGFAIELYRAAGGATVLRFGVHVGGSYIYDSYPVAGADEVGACAGIEGGYFTDPLDDTSNYFLIGAYDGEGGVYLWINNRCAAVVRPTASGGVTANAVPVLVGADPQVSATLDARFFFDGFIQQAQVQRWGDHPGQTIND